MSKRLNLLIDETGNQDLSEGRYLVAVVLHEHDACISDVIAQYEFRLAESGLSDIPFHGKDLLHGHSGYSNISVGDRKRLLTQFSRFVRELPISFFTLRYDGMTIHNKNELEARTRQDLASYIFDKLSYFQAFDVIAIYYDNGQGAVSAALHDALDFVLAKNVADYRHADPNARRLLQVADYVCTIQRISEDYDAERQSNMHELFFGNRRSFKQSFKKQLNRNNDCMRVYLGDDPKGSYVISDLGETINDLELSGFSMKGQRIDKLNSILSGFSVKEEDGELCITASAADLPMKMNMLLQAMASVDDMFLLSQSSVRNLFTEDVGNWLLDNEISYVPMLAA